ncbi:acyl-CoA dehydrogenase family protein [Nocardia sp. NPDC049190]|uniref:acyl-CoA dehydrogenase family protein n=1 Tax=Nocardia sp. NPDC049190 TaxID=3155650 RepID=UPI0033C14A97
MTTEHSAGRARFASCVADRILSAAQAFAVADRFVAEFGTGAAARDRDRTLPYLEIDRLAASGLLAVAVPAAYGGADLPPSAVAEVVRILAVADPNIAQIPHNHFVYLNLLRLAGSRSSARYFGRVLAVPVMLGAGPAHALAPDLLLEPVLVEIGATAALPGLYLSGRTFHEDGVIDRYSDRWRSVAQALATSSKAANHA